LTLCATVGYKAALAAFPLWSPRLLEGKPFSKNRDRFHTPCEDALKFLKWVYPPFVGLTVYLNGPTPRRCTSNVSRKKDN